MSQLELNRLFREIRACRICEAHLPLGPRPIVRGRVGARLLIISQAPGTRVHETGLTFNDRSGDLLRQWLNIDRETFYDENRIAIMPMGMCYPGRNQRGGDLPPRPECALRWHGRARALLPGAGLTLLVGSYAIHHYLGGQKAAGMTGTIRDWRKFLPDFFPLPHPSWRNIAWLRRNPWFEDETLPELRAIVQSTLAQSGADAATNTRPLRSDQSRVRITR